MSGSRVRLGRVRDLKPSERQRALHEQRLLQMISSPRTPVASPQVSSIPAIPHGVKHSCRYSAADDSVVHVLELNNHCVMLQQFKWMTQHDFEREWHRALEQLKAALNLPLTVVSRGLIRSMLGPRYMVLPHKTDEFYLRDNYSNVDYALPFRDEAHYIEQQTTLRMTQGAFDGEYRQASPQVRSAPPQAPAPAHPPGAYSTCSPRTFGAAVAAAVAAPAEPSAREAPRVERCEPKIGELVAHRAWFFDKERRRLTSVGYWPLEWHPEEPMADCTLLEKNPSWVEDDRGCISETNKCGVWSFKSPNGPIHEYLLDSGSGKYALRSASDYDLALILGTCWIWGTVVEHEHGYRSQFGAIRSLDHHYHQASGIWFPTGGAEGFLDELRTFYKLQPVDHAS